MLLLRFTARKINKQPPSSNLRPADFSVHQTRSQLSSPGQLPPRNHESEQRFSELCTPRALRISGLVHSRNTSCKFKKKGNLQIFLTRKLFPQNITTVTDLHFSLDLFIQSLSPLNILFSSVSRLLSHLISVSLSMTTTVITGSVSSLCALSARVHGPWPFRCLARNSLDTTVKVYLRITRAT